MEERGFLYPAEQYTPTAISRSAGTFGLEGAAGPPHGTASTKTSSWGRKHCFESPWNGSLMFDMRCGAAHVRVCAHDAIALHIGFAEADDGSSTGWSACARARAAVTVSFYWGLGLREVAAATSAKEMLRQGYEYEYERTPTGWKPAPAACG